jgi:hypothetical protein
MGPSLEGTWKWQISIEVIEADASRPHIDNIIFYLRIKLWKSLTWTCHLATSLLLTKRLQDQRPGNPVNKSDKSIICYSSCIIPEDKLTFGQGPQSADCLVAQQSAFAGGVHTSSTSPQCTCSLWAQFRLLANLHAQTWSPSKGHVWPLQALCKCL